MDNLTPGVPSNENTAKEIDYDVPELKDIYENGFMEIVKEVYDKYKKDNIDKNKKINNIDDELMKVCIAYLSIIQYLYDNSSKDLSFFTTPSNDEDLNTVKIIIKSVCGICEDDFDLINKSRRDDEMDYVKEVIRINRLLERKEEVLKFMKTVNNVNIKKAVRVYFLDHDLRLENMGIKHINDIYEDAEYYAYSYIYSIYLNCIEDASGFQKKIYKLFPSLDENIVKLRNLSSIGAIETVRNCLTELNQKLCTEEKFFEKRDCRRYNFQVILDIATRQIEQLKKEGFYSEKTR